MYGGSVKREEAQELVTETLLAFYLYALQKLNKTQLTLKQYYFYFIINIKAYHLEIKLFLATSR